jgi:hypothetical protein
MLVTGVTAEFSLEYLLRHCTGPQHLWTPKNVCGSNRKTPPTRLEIADPKLNDLCTSFNFLGNNVFYTKFVLLRHKEPYHHK